MSEVKVNLAPTPSAFYAEHNRNIGFPQAMWELIDNSFDAGANAIHITVSANQKLVSIADDGGGCPNLDAFTSQGTRRQQTTTESGRYGVGVKAAALYFWGTYDIETRHNGFMQKASICWDDVVACGVMEMSGTREQTSTSNGTILSFRDVARKFPSAEKLKRNIVEWFWPALQSGKQITLTTDEGTAKLKARKEPEWVESIEISGTVGGLEWSGVAGLLAGENPSPGFTLVKAHRVVTKRFNDVLADYNAPQFHATVFLKSRDWHLNTLKDDLANEAERELLNVQLEEQCQDLLEKAALAARSEFYEGLSDELSEELFGSKRFRSPPQNKTGTITPKRTPQRRVPREKQDEGQNNSRARGATVEVCPYPGNGQIGFVESLKKNRKVYKVHINISRSDVADAHNREDKTAMKLLVMSMLAGFIACTDGEEDARQLLLLEMDPQTRVEIYNTILGKWFPRVSGTEPKQLLAA